DPVSGNFMFWDTAGKGWVYDWRTDTWTNSGIQSPLLSTGSGSRGVDEVVAGPIPTYGVIMFVRFLSNSASGDVYLYKHTSGASAQEHTMGTPCAARPGKTETSGAAAQLIGGSSTSSDSGATLPANKETLGILMDYETRCKSPGVVRCVGFD